MLDVSIVVPCYNEEAVLPETARRLGALLRRLVDRQTVAPRSCVYFVDDGSRDGTWTVIQSLAREHPFVRGIRLSRNRGHQNALLAGLFTAEGDAVVTIDADLQDDVDAIGAMLEAHVAGHDIVYGVRRRRDSDTYFKRCTARAYYRLLRAMGVEVVPDHADFRLMSRRAIEALREFREVNLFLRGIVPLLGFPATVVFYDRASRFAGESKYPLRRMLGFAIQGVTSFSAVPLRLITWLGLTIFAASFVVTLWALWERFVQGSAVPGWASTVIPSYLLGGIQLLCIGIIGEYLAKIYIETKHRPRFHVEAVVRGGSGALRVVRGHASTADPRPLDDDRIPPSSVDLGVRVSGR
jgi:glycosyltransferase involved in cell wall biosynthesis